MAYTTINKPDDYFNTKLYTGTASTNAQTGIGFQPDWVWLKARSYFVDHLLVDSMRGTDKYLKSNGVDAEQTSGIILQSFDSDGFTLGNSDDVNRNSETYASWNWKANGSGSSNTAGSINSTVSVNTTSGFSIVSWTGTGANATIGHGLGVAPKMILLKCRTQPDKWIVYHNSIGNTKYVVLNDTVGGTTGSTHWNNTSPTSSVFSTGSSGNVSGVGETFIAYCFADVQGYSKFGSYTGNGNADGPFCFNGFSPSFVMIKRSDDNSTGRWVLWDNKRNTFNLMDNALFPNSNALENDGFWKIDGLSNGFKIKDPEVEMNSNGGFYTYMAFAEAPLVGTNGVTAKAR